MDVPRQSPLRGRPSPHVGKVQRLLLEEILDRPRYWTAARLAETYDMPYEKVRRALKALGQRRFIEGLRVLRPARNGAPRVTVIYRPLDRARAWEHQQDSNVRIAAN